MRPYLSILRDSFREAFVSKALWAMLALIGLLLIVCACFGYRERTSTLFIPGDVNDAQSVAIRIVNDEDPQVAHLRSLIGAKEMKQLKRIATPPEDAENEDERRVFFQQLNRVTEILNGLVKNDETYDKEVWTRLPESGELSELVAKGDSLKTVERHRRNRLLVEQALREHLRYRPPERVAVTFATMETPEEVALTKEQLDGMIKTFIIPTILSIVVGIVGILFAVAITSPIIPRMYDQGALHLLLSKPVSRSLVFVTKFFGGCAFIVLYISLLLSGLFLILGVRFGIWNPGLLYCIPVFVFSFSIFYSVSALAGAIWKNAIVSLAMTAIFWFGCTTVGVTHAVMKSFVDQKRIVRLTGDDDEFWGVRESGQVTVWDKDKESWSDFRGGRGNQRWLGPIEDTKNDRILVATASDRPFMAVSGRYELFSSTAENGWAREDVATLPSESVALFSLPSGTPIVATATGVLELQDPKSANSDKEELPGDEAATEDAKDDANQGGGIAGLWNNVFGNKEGPLKPIGPKERLSLTAPVRAAMTPTGEIYLVDSSRLVVLKLNGEGQFEVSRDEKFRLPKSEKKKDEEDKADTPVVPLFIQATDKHVLMGTLEGDVLLYNADLKLLKTFRPLKWNDEPRFAFTSPTSEKFYVLNYRHTMQVVDAREQTFTEPNWPHQGEISAFRTLPNEKVALVSTGDRVTILDVKKNKTEREDVADVPTWVWIFRSVLSPLYQVFPRPGDLEQTVQYLTSQKTSISPTASDTMGTTRVAIDPWDPIRANLIFIVVMLIVSCVYIERQEL